MSSFLCAALDHLDQLAAPDHIDSCGDRMIIGQHRFLFEFFDPVVFIHAKHTKSGHILIGIHIFAHNSHIGTFCDMVFQNFVIIQFIYTITGCDDHIGFMASLQKIQVLINRICGSLIPEAVIRSDRRCKHKQTSLLSSEIPPFGRAQMLIQRSCVVLCQDCNFRNMRIGHITQCKVNAPIASRYRHRCDGTSVGQFSHPVVITACQNNS